MSSIYPTKLVNMLEVNEGQNVRRAGCNPSTFTANDNTQLASHDLALNLKVM